MGVRGKRELAPYGGLLHLVIPGVRTGGNADGRVWAELYALLQDPTVATMPVLRFADIRVGVELWDVSGPVRCSAVGLLSVQLQHQGTDHHGVRSSVVLCWSVF